VSAGFSIKINRHEGALEIAGPEQEWVDAKLAELSEVYTSPLTAVSEGDDNSGPKKAPKRTRARSPARSTSSENTEGRTNAPAKPQRSRRSSGRPQRNPELEAKLTRQLLEKFAAYVAKRQAAWDKKQTHQTAIIATFLEDEINWTGIDEDDMYTVYRALSLEGPTNYRSTLQNAYGRDRFFTGINEGKYALSMAGEKFGRSGSLNA
jgi:hypothetical protein